MAARPRRGCAHVHGFAHAPSGRGLLTARSIRLEPDSSLAAGSAVGFVLSFIKVLEVLRVSLLKLKNATDALVWGSA